MDLEKYMLRALALARKALSVGEVPIGAVLVNADGQIIGRGYNRVECGRCQVEHAEVRAIRQACRKVGGWRLDGCTLFVTLEPCLMCLGLIGLTRIKRVYFGAQSPVFGVGSSFAVASKKAGSSSLIQSKFCLSSVYRKKLSMVGGLKAQECADILKLFFEKARKKREVSGERKTGVP